MIESHEGVVNDERSNLCQDNLSNNNVDIAKIVRRDNDSANRCSKTDYPSASIPKKRQGCGRCDVLAQKIHNLKNPECRPQLFINQADASKRKKNNTIKMILVTPLAIRNTILIHKIPQLAEDLRHRTPFYMVHWRCVDCWAVRMPYTRNVIRSLVLNKSQRPVYSVGSKPPSLTPPIVEEKLSK